MSGSRIELDGSITEEGGQQFVSGRGLHSDGYTRIVRIEPHGFMSNPIKGAKAFVLSPNGNPDEAYVFGGEHPSHRPAGLPGGASALYDSSGNIIKLIGGDGVFVDIAGAGFTVRKGGVTLTISADGFAFTGGKLTHNGKDIGDTHVHGGVIPGGSNTSVPA